jgi:hypothetical protein
VFAVADASKQNSRLRLRHRCPDFRVIGWIHSNVAANRRAQSKFDEKLGQTAETRRGIAGEPVILLDALHCKIQFRDTWYSAPQRDKGRSAKSWLPPPRHPTF